MVKKKALTIDDLLLFCKENNFAKFSSKESGYQLAVQVPTTFEVESESDENHRGMLRLKFRIFHEGLNRNGSFVSHKAAVKASKTIADRPIMAAIHKLDDGSWDFESHEMEIIENDEGEPEVNYIEKQVGSFSSEKPFWEHDDELDKDYICAYGYIAEEYTKAADIIREKGWTKNSCELSIDELAYNARENYLDLKEFYVAASTLLGKRDDGTEIQEGMVGSRADIAAFSKDNNSVLSHDEQVIKLLSELNEKIDGLNIEKFSRKEDAQMKKEFEDEVTETSEGKVEESADDTPDVQAETFEDTPRKKKKDVDDPALPEDSEEDDEPDVQQQQDAEPTQPEEPEEEEPEEETEEPEEPEDDTNYYSVDYTISINGEKKDFSVSLKEKLNALTTLVNDTYGEADMAWYDVDCYDEEKVVLMHDWWGNKHYRQSYSVKKDEYSLKGDRIEVFMSFLSADEQKQLEQMKSNYSAIETELVQYKAEPEKQAILSKECYAQISETDAFKELASQDSHFSMSVDDVQAKADEILLEYAKGHEIKFSAEESEKKSVGIKLFGNPTKKVTKGNSRYGGLFSKK